MSNPAVAMKVSTTPPSQDLLSWSISDNGINMAKYRRGGSLQPVCNIQAVFGLDAMRPCPFRVGLFARCRTKPKFREVHKILTRTAKILVVFKAESCDGMGLVGKCVA